MFVHRFVSSAQGLEDSRHPERGWFLNDGFTDGLTDGPWKPGEYTLAQARPQEQVVRALEDMAGELLGKEAGSFCLADCFSFLTRLSPE